MEKNEFRLALLHPRYWLTWIGMGLWCLISQLPYRVQLWLGSMLGRLSFNLAKDRRRIAARNLELCFPDMDARARKKLLKANFKSTGIALMETGMAWFLPHWRLRRLYTIEGLEHLHSADGRGNVMLSMHFTTLDIGAAFFNMSATMDGMYRPHKNPVYDYVQRLGRERHNANSDVIERKDVRMMIRSLKKGRAVWYAPDQDYGPKQSVFVPFFGVPAATVTGTAKFAKLGNARVVPFTQTRLPGGQGYKVTVHPPLENYPCGDDELDAARINGFVEQQVRRHPEQYLWAHKRFKTRPPGEPKLY